MLSVNIGYGTDLHGQDPTAAAVAAVQDAASRASLPGILNFIPGLLLNYSSLLIMRSLSCVWSESTIMQGGLME